MNPDWWNFWSPKSADERAREKKLKARRAQRHKKAVEKRKKRKRGGKK